MPRLLIGIIPTSMGGFDSPAQAAEVFARNEIGPLQARFMELNQWIGEEVIHFEPYSFESHS